MENAATSFDTDTVINASPISPLQIMVGVLGAAILFVDGFNTQVINFVTPQIAKEWSISRDVFGWMGSADKFGLLIGYLLVAPLSGRFGHRRVAILCIAAFGSLACLSIFSANVTELIVIRLAIGIGLGGALPSSVTLTGEYFPHARRSTAITFIYCGFSLGQGLPGEVANLVLKPFGWRGALFIGGGLALLLAVTLLCLLPESLEYLVNRSSHPQKAANILRRIAPSLAITPNTRLTAGEGGGKLSFWRLLPQLFENNRAFGTLLIWLTIGMNLLVITSLQVWLTKILEDAGFAQHISIIATEASFFAGIFGAFTIGPLMDRFGPYRVLAALFALGALFSVLVGLSLSSSTAMLIVMAAFGSGFCTSGAQKAGNALAIYFYPVALRSTGLGWGLGVGRLGAIVGPLLVGDALTAGWSASAAFAATAIPMLIGCVAILAMGRHYAAAGRDKAADALPLAGKA